MTKDKYLEVFGSEDNLDKVIYIKIDILNEEDEIIIFYRGLTSPAVININSNDFDLKSILTFNWGFENEMPKTVSQFKVHLSANEDKISHSQ